MVSPHILASKVEIFTLPSQPIQNKGQASVCVLEKLSLWEEGVNKKFDSSLSVEEAVDVANRFIKGASPVINKLITCLNRASTLQIKKLPAIVVDERYVAYGVLDVEHVLALLSENQGGL